MRDIIRITLIPFLILALVFSLWMNIDQYTKLSYYQKMFDDAQEFIANAIPKFSQTKAKAERNLKVNLSEARCMAEGIYYEAATQSLIGKIAVGQVILNRVKSPKYPKTVCDVVNQKTGDICQFSWACEDLKDIPNSKAWKQSQQVAYDLLSKDTSQMVDITEGSTHFHTTKINPGWKLKPTTKIDDHQFYR